MSCVLMASEKSSCKSPHPLLAMLKTKSPKILAEATTDRLWGTGIQLRDSCVLDTEKWSGTGWLSRMLITIRDEQS